VAKWRRSAFLAVALAFGIAFIALLADALLQSPKPFYYDSGQYWEIAELFTRNGHFSLMNFEDQFRGYGLPLIYHELRALARGLTWTDSSIVKLFNALVFASIGAVLAPMFAETAWPEQRWGLWRRLALTALLIVFWDGYLNFPLSDFPALAAALLALIAVARPDKPGWMLCAGIACALAIDIRSAYETLLPVLIVLAVWAFFEQRGTAGASTLRRCVCLGLLVAGFVAVSLPQSLTAHRYFHTWSFVPAATLNTAEVYLTPGLASQRYDTYVGGEHPPKMLYADPAGERLLRTQKDGKLTSTGQYFELIASHPIAMGALLSRHAINGLDARYRTGDIEDVEGGGNRWLRIAGFALVFLALVRLLWPTARRSLGPARWRYPIALVLGATGVASAVEARYMLPVCTLVYLLALAPGWPKPIGSPEPGLRWLRTPAALLLAGAVFAVVIYHVVSATTSHLTFLQ
jgi:hypothetical protein